MRLIDEIKARLKQVADKTPELKDEALEKLKQYSDSGLEITRELFTEISNKVSDITAITKLQYHIKDLENELNQEYLKLGKIGFSASISSKNSDQIEKVLSKQIENIEWLKTEIRKKSEEYARYKKQKSENYIINKFSDELGKAGAVIDQTFVSEKSNVKGKLLKEVLFPKEALISAIKRGDNVIIPDGNTQLLSGDLVTVFGKENDVKKIIKRLNPGK